MIYTYKNEIYEDIFSLAKVMYLDDSFFLSEFKNNEDLLHFIEEKNVLKAEKIRKLLSLALPEDILIYKISYLLNPTMSFRFHGLLFEDYKDLGQHMLYSSPYPDPLFMKMMAYQVLSSQMFSSLYAYSHSKQFEKVVSLEKQFATAPEESYFLLAYFLSGKTTLIYKGTEYEDLFNFVYYLSQSQEDKSALGKEISHSPYLKAYAKANKKEHLLDEYLHLNSELEKSEKNLDTFLKAREKKIFSDEK